MLLNVTERLTLLQALPKEGNFITLKIVRKLREDLSFTEDEHIKFNITGSGKEYMDENGKKSIVPPGQIRFKNEEAEIQIGKKATEIIVECLGKLDKQNKLTEAHYSLYEKFIGDE